MRSVVYVNVNVLTPIHLGLGTMMYNMQVYYTTWIQHGAMSPFWERERERNKVFLRWFALQILCINFPIRGSESPSFGDAWHYSNPLEAMRRTLAEYFYVSCMSEPSIQFGVGACSNLTPFRLTCASELINLKRVLLIYFESHSFFKFPSNRFEGQKWSYHICSVKVMRTRCTSSFGVTFIGVFAYTCWDLSLPCKCNGLQILQLYVLWAVVDSTKPGDSVHNQSRS